MARRFRRFWFAGLLLCAWAASPAALATPLTADQALRDIRILERSLVALHPGLYRYRTPAEIDAEFAAARAQVAAGSSSAQMFLIASRLAAAVRCGHTWTNPLNQSERLVAELFDRDDKLPLRLRLVERRFLVTASADPDVAAGDELLAIDGRTPAELVAELLPLLRADGSSDGKRLSQIDTGPNGGAMDRFFPLLHPPTDGRHALRVRGRDGREREVSVAATTVAAREQRLVAAGQPPIDERWSFELRGDSAVMTLPTFSFFRAEFDWRAFFDRSFDELASRRITRLVIDLRRNEGGDDRIGADLLSRLIHAPYMPPASRAEVAYERVPYVLARFLDTWDFGFFDRTGQLEPAAENDGRPPPRNRVLKGRNLPPAAIEPAARPFRGRVIALIGPEMSSAGFLIARDLRRSHAATLVGQPTGGNRRGLNGGELAWVTLPNSGVAVDIPLIAWMPPDAPPDAGIAPDVAVTPRFDAVAAGEDPEMAAAMRLAQSASAGTTAAPDSARPAP